MGHRAKVFGNETAQVICIVGGVHDDMPDARQAFDQATRLRAIAPLARCDYGPDRQAERVNGGVDLRGQPAFGAANSGSFKPPF